MLALKPTLYLDKGALGSLNLRGVCKEFQICYSEATLFDLLSDQSGIRDSELSMLNEVGALFLYRVSGEVCVIQDDALKLMKEIDPLELDFMASTYRFLNGGGALSLFDVLNVQLSALLNADDETRIFTQAVLGSVAADETLDKLKSQKSENWRKELQRATKSWSQTPDVTLRSVFDKNPGLYREVEQYFPNTAPKPEQIHLAAMLLGVLQMGSDRGIQSPDDHKSGKAARNGYIDCLHIMFGLHCNFFLTTDKATLKRFCLLNDYWQFGRKAALVLKQI